MVSEEGRQLLTVKEVAEATGIPASTIRYYDQQFEDYLELERGAGRRRLFSQEAVQRLVKLRDLLKDSGLSMRQVRQKLGGQDPLALEAAPAAPSAELSGELDGLRQELAALKEQLAEVPRLQETVRNLEEQLAELRGIQRRTLALVTDLTK
ncbi:MAG: MerR family transcriptional regulator [Deltaproteobacteria bacterium]|nr:MerR family transcriptional regulator [Deltaproteobacteria bacterium]